MVFFIILALFYITGMSVAAIMEIQSATFFLFLGCLFLIGGFIPFWSRHSEKIQYGEWRSIIADEFPIPIMTMGFLLVAFFFFGLFRYVYALFPIPPNHIARIMNTDDPRTKWRLVGKIIEEPSLKNDYLEVLVEPEIIQEQPWAMKKKAPKTKKKTGGKRSKKGEEAVPPPETQGASEAAATPEIESVMEQPSELNVDGGLVLVQVFEESDAFQKVKFNQKVEILGRFSVPSGPRNPGALDYQRSLINRGIFRTSRLATSKDGYIKILSETTSGTGSLWYRFALFLRTEFLKVVKQTMPYPESSFLGGVLLGLKGGLPNYITTEFRMTGVSHVLAVSGLHVTIIAALFYGLFTVFRVPLKIFAPIIVFFLFTFALIVGWPSSAVRAAMMNSLFVLSRAYLKERGFRTSIIFALASAAFYILTVSPLQLNEPSFTLSFMAIYALAMFSGPAEQLLRTCLRGPGLFFAVNLTVFFYLTVAIKRDLILYEYFFPCTAVFLVCLLGVSRKLSESSGFQSLGFEMLPQWLSSFTASQVGIFLGMMGPLSAFYFGSMSLSAPIANMIAIPLIGIIVQMGMIAGIIGSFVPLIGMHLALLINAGNWVAVKFFLGMAHFFSVLIPFPRVSQPGFASILLWYVILHLFFYWEPIRDYSIAFGNAILELWEDPDYKMPLGLAGGLIVGVCFYFAIFGISRIKSVPTLRTTLLDVGYGSSLLVEKGGQTLLVDAGMRDTLSGYDIGERVIQPAISSKNFKNLDNVILTTFLPEKFSGLIKVMENYRIYRIYAPFPIPTDGKPLIFQEFVASYSLSDRKIDEDLKKGIIPSSAPNYYWEQSFMLFNDLIKAIRKNNPEVILLKEDTKIKGFEDCVKVEFPNEPRERFSGFFDVPVVFITMGNLKFAYANGNIKNWSRLIKERLDLLMLTELPYPIEMFEGFLESNPPLNVALSFRKPSGWLLDRFYLGQMLDGRVIQFNKHSRKWLTQILRTDKTGAVQADVIKDRLAVTTFLSAESPWEGKK